MKDTALDSLEMADELYKGLILFKELTVQREMLKGKECRKEVNVAVSSTNSGQVGNKMCVQTHKDLMYF